VCRRIPIDFAAVAAESGMTAGALGFSPALGCWVVQNVTRNAEWPDVVMITAPAMEAGETRLEIHDDHWCFYENQP